MSDHILGWIASVDASGTLIEHPPLEPVYDRALLRNNKARRKVAVEAPTDLGSYYGQFAYNWDRGTWNHVLADAPLDAGREEAVAFRAIILAMVDRVRAIEDAINTIAPGTIVERDRIDGKSLAVIRERIGRLRRPIHRQERRK